MDFLDRDRCPCSLFPMVGPQTRFSGRYKECSESPGRTGQRKGVLPTKFPKRARYRSRNHRSSPHPSARSRKSATSSSVNGRYGFIDSKGRLENRCPLPVV